MSKPRNVANLAQFTQDNALAVSRTVTSKLKDSVSVKDFGAIGNGVNDDTTTIQAAINSGQPINFPPGTYIISSPIFVQSGTTLIGAGKARIKQINNNPNRNSFFAMLVAEGAVKQDITLRGLIIDGNAQNNVDPGVPNPSGNQDAFWAGTMLAQIAFSNIKNVTVEDCVLENSFGSGMWITSCEGVRVTGNTVRNFRITGIAIRDYNLITTTQSERAIIANNVVESGVVGIHGIFGARSATITGNSLSNLKDANRFPSYAYSGTYPNVWPTTGGFKTASDPGYVSPALPGDGAGVELTGGLTDPTSDINNSIDITGNTAYNCMVGFRSEETSKNITITGNSSRLSDQAGILVFSATQTTVSSNTITESQNTGITIRRLEASVNPSAVRTEKVSVIGNTVTGSAYYGMALGGVRYVTVVGNVFSGNNTLNSPTGGSVTMFKIDSDPCENCIFTGNQFVNANGNEAYGILSGDSGNRGNIVSSNFFTNFNVAATNLDQAGNTFANNRGLNIGPINVKEFGATGDGITDDTIKIQAAINFIAGNGGGEVLFPPGTYCVSQTLTITSDKVFLIGSGGAVDGNVIFVGGMSEAIDAAATRIKWIGSVGGGPVLTVKPAIDNGTLPPIQSGGISDLMIDGDAKAGIGLECISWRYGECRNLSVMRCTSINAKLGVTQVQTLGGNNSMAFCEFSNCIFSNATLPGNTAKPLVLWGNALLGNACFQQFTNCQFINASYVGSCVELENCDSNTFIHCRWSGSLVLNSTDTGTYSPTAGNEIGALARHNVFLNTQGHILSKAKISNPQTQGGPTGYNAHSNMVFGYSRENGVPAPTIEPYSDLQYWATALGLSNNLGGVITGRAANVSEITLLSGDQSIPNGTPTKVLLNAVGIDYLGGASGVNSRITIPGGVKYVRFSFGGVWDSNSTGSRWIGVRRNDGFYMAEFRVPASASSNLTSTSKVFAVEPGQSFELYVEQTSGAPLALKAAFGTFLQIEYY